MDLSSVKNLMRKKEEEKFLSQYHPFKIWKSSDNRWYTTVVDEDTNKSKKVARINYQDLIELLKEHYGVKDMGETVTLLDYYDKWLVYTNSCVF